MASTISQASVPAAATAAEPSTAASYYPADYPTEYTTNRYTTEPQDEHREHQAGYQQEHQAGYQQEHQTGYQGQHQAGYQEEHQNDYRTEQQQYEDYRNEYQNQDSNQYQNEYQQQHQQEYQQEYQNQHHQQQNEYQDDYHNSYHNDSDHHNNQPADHGAGYPPGYPSEHSPQHPEHPPEHPAEYPEHANDDARAYAAWADSLAASGPASDPTDVSPPQRSALFSPVPASAVPVPLSINPSPTTPAAVPDPQYHSPGTQDAADEIGVVSEAVADLGLTFIPRNPALLADSISNADFDVAPELSSSAPSVAPSSIDPPRSQTSDDQVQTPLTPGNLASIPDLQREPLQLSQQDEYQRQEYQEQQQNQPQSSPLVEMELNRLAERERNMCPEVQAFLAEMPVEHQSFWLSQRRDRLRLSPAERHQYIVHQALLCSPLLSTDDINEFCMVQQGLIFEDLRAEGAPICSTAWFDWRLDKDIWDHFVGAVTGEPSMWSDDPPPLDRAPYLDGYQLTVHSPSPPLSPDDSYYVLHAEGAQTQPESPAQEPRLQPPSPPGPMVADESTKDDGPRYFGEEGVRSAYQEPESPMGSSLAYTLSPGSPATTTAMPATGSNVDTPRKPPRPHSRATNSGFRSPRRTSFSMDTPKPPPSRGSGLDMFEQTHDIGGLGHIEGAKGMPGMFKAVNYQPVVWGER